MLNLFIEVLNNFCNFGFYSFHNHSETLFSMNISLVVIALGTKVQDGKKSMIIHLRVSLKDGVKYMQKISND